MSDELQDVFTIWQLVETWVISIGGIRYHPVELTLRLNKCRSQGQSRGLDRSMEKIGRAMERIVTLGSPALTIDLIQYQEVTPQ